MEIINHTKNSYIISSIIICLLLNGLTNGFSTNNLRSTISIGLGRPCNRSSNGNSISSISCPTTRYYCTKKKYHLFSTTKDKMETTEPLSLSSSSSTQSNINHEPKKPKMREIPKLIMDIYVSYVSRLWRETNVTSRETIANQKAYYAIKHVQHLLQDGEEYVNIMNHNDSDKLDDIEKKEMARGDLLNACNVMLDVLGSVEQEKDLTTTTISDNKEKNDHVSMIQDSDFILDSSSDEKALISNNNNVEETGQVAAKKKSRSVLFGATMGAIVACWVFSGNFLFTALFTLMTILGQLEYYRMVMKVGIYPARKISVVGACAMFVTVSLPKDLILLWFFHILFNCC